MSIPSQRKVIRSQRYEKLKRKIGFYERIDEFGQKLIAAASSVLQQFDPNDQTDYEDILSAVHQVLPTALEVFTGELFKNPKLPITVLKDVMTFYIPSPLTNKYTTEVGLRKLDDVDDNLKSLIWLASQDRLPADQAKSVCSYYEQISTLKNSVWPPKETGNHEINSHSMTQLPSIAYGNTPKRHSNEHQSYSSVGSIPKLPLSRPNNSSPNIRGCSEPFHTELKISWIRIRNGKPWNIPPIIHEYV